MTLRLYTIGRAAAVVGERTIEPSAELVFAGLLVLGLEGGRRLSREDFAELLWPDVEHTKRGARLRWLLNRFRSIGLVFDRGTDISLPSKAIIADFAAVDALDLDSIGPILPGYRPEFSAPLARWVNEQRDRICAQVVRQLMPQLTAAAHCDDWTRVADVASAIQRVDALNEEAALTLAEARCRMGGKAQALDGLDAYLDALGEDRPELQLSAKVLQRRIRKADETRPMSSEPRFVGRAEQLNRISALLTATRSGSGGALMVAGPAGLGKTRLLDEAVARVALAGMQTIRVRCEQGDVVRPLSGLAELIPKVLELRGALGANPASFERLSRFTQTDDGPGGSADQTSPEILRSRLGAALLDVLEASSTELPVIIVIDDLQWADQALHSLWEHVVRWSTTHAVAVLFGFRTSVQDQPTLSVPIVPLSSLEPLAASNLLDDLLSDGQRTMSAGERNALLARGAGSPLFLREIVRQWLLTGSAGQLPTSLNGLFDAGLAGLSAHAMRGLEVASILGTQASLERMEGVMQVQRGTFIDAIVELEAAGILSADTKGNAYGHVLWADAALRRVSESIARVLHRHAAEWFERELLGNPSARLLWEIAHHWESAGRPEEARTAIVRGARHLAQQGFLDEAADAYARATELAQSESTQLPLIRHHIELLYAIGRINDLAAEIDRHERLAAKLDPSYDRHNDLEMVRLWVHHAQMGGIDAMMHGALACAREIRATSAHRLNAAKEAARAAALIEPSLLAELLAIVEGIQPKTRDERWNRARVEWEYHLTIGDVRIAIACAERVLEDQQQGDDRRTEGAARGMCAVAYLAAGRFGDARAMFTEAIRFARQYGLTALIVSVFDELIGFSLDTDPPDVTYRLIEEARQPASTFEGLGAVQYSASIPNYEAQLLVTTGHPERALRMVTGLDEAIAVMVPSWRGHMLGIHLMARTALGLTDRIGEIVDGLGTCFDRPARWLDWPATVYAGHLEQHAGVQAAANFASRFVREVRRELYPPPKMLIDLAAQCAPREDVVPLNAVVDEPRRGGIALSG